MKTLREVMRPGFVLSVQRDATVSAAVRVMATHNVGIVAVLDGDRLAGVFSERDVVRRVVDCGLDPTATPVEHVMTGEHVGNDHALNCERRRDPALRELTCDDLGHAEIGERCVLHVLMLLLATLWPPLQMEIRLTPSARLKRQQRQRTSRTTSPPVGSP